jgi:DNA modification methylase
MAMKPYYSEKGIEIYFGDCREVLPLLDIADAVITDPPYNVGKDYGTHNDAMPEDEYEQWAREIAYLSQCSAPRQFWVAPRYKLNMWLKILPSSHLVVIKRGAFGPCRGGWADQFEIALACGKPHACVPDLWENIRLKGEGYFFTEETYGHPGYTPYSIMRRAVELMSVESVIDPFCGTGTTLRAAKDLGRRAIGIEIEERYCEIAAKRLSQEVLDFAARQPL